jgi:hypothetical protein
VPDGAQQRLVAERLRQELECSPLHGLDRHRHVAVSRNEDDRHVNPIDGDALLQIEAAEVRKTDVEYQAARDKKWWTGEKFLRGREGLGLPPCAADQQFQRLAHGDIVVDDEHGWCGV